MATQRRWIFWAAGAYAGILVVVVVGLLLVFREARERLDEALGLRLQAVATSTVQFIDGDALVRWTFDPEPSTDLIWLESRLQQIRRQNDLAEITLCDPDGFVVIAASGRLDRGTNNVFWDLDRPAVELARQGFPAASHLYRSGPLYQKSAHAPVFDIRGEVAGVLTVDGNADFFGTLTTLRRGATVTIATVVIFLALLGLLLHRSHRALERARASLAQQENLVAMGRMTAGIAHEIRNPLGIIRGSAEHLQMVLNQHGVEDEVAAFIPDEVDRLDRILTGYLAFGSDDGGESEDVDLGSLVRRTIVMTGDEMARLGADVTLAEPVPAAPVHGDPRRLQQVLLNLLLNARDAMPDGGPVIVTVTGNDAHGRVSVADRGPGLPDGDAAHIFF